MAALRLTSERGRASYAEGIKRPNAAVRRISIHGPVTKDSRHPTTAQRASRDAQLDLQHIHPDLGEATIANPSRGKEDKFFESDCSFLARY